MTGLVTIRRRVPIRTLLHSRIMLSNFGTCPNFRFLDGDGSSHTLRNCWDIQRKREYFLLVKNAENGKKKTTSLITRLVLPFSVRSRRCVFALTCHTINSISSSIS